MIVKFLDTDFSNPNRDWFCRNFIYNVAYRNITKNIIYPCTWE